MEPWNVLTSACLLQGPGAETHSFQHESSAEARGGCGPVLGRTTRERPLPLGWFPEGLWLPQRLRPPPQHPSLMRRGRALRPVLAQGPARAVPAQGFLGRAPQAPLKLVALWHLSGDLTVGFENHSGCIGAGHMSCVLGEVA